VSLYLGLVHHPINNKNGETITTSVTNMDIHDISRSCRTFGVKNYFIITPLQAQHQLIQRILGHWEQDVNGAYNPDRQEAIALARLVNSVEDACQKITESHKMAPEIVVTGANFQQHNLACSDFRKKLNLDERPYLLLFGTGWGLHDSVVEKANWQLDPILGRAADGYNHLSVRSAVAIYLDRITRES
jgi:hypothetical protein